MQPILPSGRRGKMSKSKLGLSLVFLAIAVFVSGTLVSSVRTTYAPEGLSALDAIHLLQRV
jgi:hypothetical protein